MSHRWRVTEIAQILLILLDSRCPLLHYPPSLASYLASPHIAGHTRAILVLTKVDISGPVRAAAWTQFLNRKLPHLRVVQVESYTEKPRGESTSGRKYFEPHLPSAFRQALVEALKDTHTELLTPPERLRNNPERLKTWKPPVKREVNWQQVLHAYGGQVGTFIGGPTAPKPKEEVTGDEIERETGDDEYNTQVEHEFLTIGVIGEWHLRRSLINSMNILIPQQGQPNVGKSSLLNALFGVPKVRASRTPGKVYAFDNLCVTFVR